MSIKNLTEWHPLQQYAGGGGGGSGPQIHMDRTGGVSPGGGNEAQGTWDNLKEGLKMLLDRLLGMPGQGLKEQTFETTQRLDAGDSIELFSASTTKGQGVMQTAKAVGFANVGSAPIALSIKLPLYSADASAGSSHYLQTILPVGQIFTLPTTRLINSNDQELDDGTVVAMVAPNSNLYVDSTADVDSATANGIIGSETNTTVYLEDGHSKFFRVGDLIRLTNEIMEVTAVGTGADLGNSTLTVKRGMLGSTADSGHADDDVVMFPFFNAYHEFDDTSYNGGGNGSAVKIKTNVNGKFKSTNFFGYGRATTLLASGLLPGSISLKFYTSGYQELGISGAGVNTSSALAKSTTYQFDLSVDGSAATDVNFTTDASNVNWGGKNGVISKINTAIKTLNDTSGNALLDRKCTASIVNGDIRFTSGSHLSTSAIALTDSSGSDNDIWGVGRVPAVGSIRTAIGASLPEETVFDPYTGEESSNVDAFMYDDGAGNLIYKGSNAGTINYDSGEIDFVGPINAEFEVSVAHGSNLSGRVNSTGGNTIEEISARSVNPKVEGLIHMKVIG